MIEYKNDENSSRGSARGAVCAYHRKEAFRDFRNGASLGDIARIGDDDKAAFAMSNVMDVNAKYGIGFEIEKNRLSRGAVREYPLFCGFERDSSCGYEAVTNILPLVGASPWRNKVYSMFVEAERIIDDRWSPSNGTCGGHMSVSVVGMSGDELMTRLRPIAGIITALYRLRLRNTYCNSNITMVGRDNVNSEHVFGGWLNDRSSVANVRQDSVEFRIPSRITSVQSLMRRYELMYVLVDSAVKGHTPSVAFRRVKPIVLAMYGGDEAKAAKVMSLGRSFCKMTRTGQISLDLIPFVDPYGSLRSHYSRLALQGCPMADAGGRTSVPERW
mgnify:FL=1